MSSTVPADHHPSTTSSASGASSVNASLDSAFRGDPAHRGSLTPLELDAIHQTASFKQAAQIEEEDNHELAAKLKQLQHAKKSTK